MPTRSRARTTIDAPASVLTLKRPPTHPGDVLLEEYLKPAGLSQVEAARRMNIPLNRLNEVIRGKRGVSADTALRLATLLRDLGGTVARSSERLGPVARCAGIAQGGLTGSSRSASARRDPSFGRIR